MSVKPFVLVVDDEEDIRSSVSEYLSLHGMEVATAEGGEAMRAAIGQRRPDVVLLDLRMPGEDGLTLARWLKANLSAGILMLTAVAEPIDRIVGLEVGADDYMAKPFDLRELLARVRSVLRRSAEQVDPSRHVRLGRCWFEIEARMLHFDDGERERLSRTEFELLNAFVQSPRKVWTRDDLLSLAGDDSEAFDRSIDGRISRLRRKIERDPENPEVIRTLRGFGYSFEPAAVAPGTPRPPETAAPRT